MIPRNISKYSSEIPSYPGPNFLYFPNYGAASSSRSGETSRESETLGNNKGTIGPQVPSRGDETALYKTNAGFLIVRIHPPNDVRSFLVDLLCFFSLKALFVDRFYGSSLH